MARNGDHLQHVEPLDLRPRQWLAADQQIMRIHPITAIRLDHAFEPAGIRPYVKR